MRSKGGWRKTVKRLLCAVTTLALVFSLLPVGVLAAGETEETEPKYLGLKITANTGDARVLLTDFNGATDGTYEITFVPLRSYGNLGFLGRYTGEGHYYGLSIDSNSWGVHGAVSTSTRLNNSTGWTQPGALTVDSTYAAQIALDGADITVQYKTAGTDDWTSVGSYSDTGNAATHEAGGLAIRINPSGASVLIKSIKYTPKNVDGTESAKEIDYTRYTGSAEEIGYEVYTNNAREAANNPENATLSLEPIPEPESPTTNHIDPLTNILAEDDFTDGNSKGWSVSSDTIITFSDGKVRFNGGGQHNHIGWPTAMSADSFLAQFDVTAEAAAGNGCDVDFEFGLPNKYTGDRYRVRVRLQEKTVTVERTPHDSNYQTDPTWSETSQTFDWTTDQAFGVDILVKDGKITVYKDAEQLIEVNYQEKDAGASVESLSVKDRYFTLAGSWPNQQFTIDNFKVTTDDSLHIDPLAVVIENTEFTDANWNLMKSANGTNGTLEIQGGALIMGGPGGDNRAEWSHGIINSDHFLIQMDVTSGQATNSEFKVDFFKAEAGAVTASKNIKRAQVRFSFADSNTVQIGAPTTWNGKDNSLLNSSATFNYEVGKPFAVDIDVNKPTNTITVYVDGTQVAQSTASLAGFSRGYFGVAGQYDNHDIKVENLKITTPEAPIPFTLATNGSGIVAATSGATQDEDGTWRASPGATVILSAAGHNCAFENYTITPAGAVTIGDDGTFTMPDSVEGDLTITANFAGAREAGRFEVWYDDFNYETLNDTANHTDHTDNKYTVGNESMVQLVNGVVNLKTSGAYLMIPEDVSAQLADKNYRITVDVSKVSGGGALQIAFCGKGDTPADRFNNRIVVVVNTNTNKTLLRTFNNGSTNDDLFNNQDCTLGDGATTLVVEVVDNNVTLYAGGTKIASASVADNLNGRTPMVALADNTGDFVVGFDNLKVETIPTPVNISVKTMLSDAEDSDYTAGTVVASAPTAVEGDKITLTVVKKTGYTLESLEAQTADGDSYEGINIEDNSFTVPAGATEDIVIVATFAAAAETPAAKEYYIDSAAGNDSNEGTSAAQAWQSLTQLHDLVLNPGDTVYLSGTFNGQQLKFKGAGGTAEAPITITSYSESNNRPVLNGEGLDAVVRLNNQEYVTIENLEITNILSTAAHDWTSPNGNRDNTGTGKLRAIHVSLKDFGVAHNITIQNCYIHDINGELNNKLNGGIIFDVGATAVDGKFNGIPTKYDGISIKNNTFINVDRSAIKLVSSPWCNQWESTPVSWYPSTNTVVSYNYFDKIGGDAITTRDVDGTLIEHNVAKDCNYQEATAGYNVAIWPFQASNTVIQYNEAYNTHSIKDGQGFDLDHASSYNVMQYNYSHNNEGGFMLIMGQYPHTGSVVRYNISQNDADKVFELSGGIAKGIMIYNNTIYSDAKLSKGIVRLSSFKGPADKGVGQLNDIYLFNNLFVFPNGQDVFCSTNAPTAVPLETLQSKVHLYKNGYVGFTGPTEDEGAVNVALTDEVTLATVLADAGKGPDSHAQNTDWVGDTTALDGYKLVKGSPMINKGATITEALTYFNGNTMPELVANRTTTSPRDLYEGYKDNLDANSLQYVMGDAFPNVTGVKYNVDFFGSEMVEAPDIGAVESPSLSSETGVESITITASPSSESIDAQPTVDLPTLWTAELPEDSSAPTAEDITITLKDAEATHTELTDPTEVETGKVYEFTFTVTAEDDTTLEYTLRVTIQDHKHEWKDVKFYLRRNGQNWNGTDEWAGADFDSIKDSLDTIAGATRTCSLEAEKGDSATTQRVWAQKDSVEITAETAPTCEGKGTVTFTFKVQFEGAEEVTSDPFTITFTALGHDWNEPVFAWTNNDGVDPTATASRTCKRDGCQYNTTAQEAKTVTTEEKQDSRKDSTCTVAGSVVFNASATFDGDEKTYTSADHTIALPLADHQTQPVPYKAATCEEDGNQAHHKCSVCQKLFVDNEGSAGDETDLATVTIKALGHDWGDPDFVWDDTDVENPTATASRTCQRADCKQTQQAKSVTVAEKEETRVEPSCEAAGSATFTATATFEGEDGDETFTNEHPVTLDQLDHNWGEPVFGEWTENDEDGWTITATQTCTNKDPSHSQDVTVSVTHTDKPATCEESGETVYSATATVNGKEYKAEDKVVTIPAIGHEKPLTKVEQKDATDTEPGCIEHWKCTRCNTLFEDAEGNTKTTADKVIIPIGGHKLTLVPAKEATCAEPGNDEYYTCSHCEDLFADAGAEQTTTLEQVTRAQLDHNWSDPVITWSETGYTATASQTCDNITPNHSQNVDVTVTSSVTQEATCEGTGTRTYTATVEGYPNVTSTKEETIPAKNHAWSAPTFGNWTEDSNGGWTITASQVCGNDNTHTQNVNVTVTSTRTEATCDTAGSIVYTATVEGYPNVTSTKEVTIPAAGHTLQKVDEVPATATTAGVKAHWTCTVCNKLFTDAAGTQETTREALTIPATGTEPGPGTNEHQLTLVPAKAPTCEEDGNDAYYTCSHCDKLYADAGAVTETTLEKVTRKATGHTLQKVDEVPATTTAAGVKAHWICKVCGKLFIDAEGKQETTLEALAIPKLPAASDTGTPGRTPSSGTSTKVDSSAQGVVGSTTKDKSGNVTGVDITVPENAAASGDVLTAPVEVEAAASAAEAPAIDITVKGKGSAKVEIPVTDVGPGTVAIVVDKDGNETILRDCIVTEDGVLLEVEGSATVKIVDNTKTFVDIDNVGWAKNAIISTVARELFHGTTETTFEPNLNTDRGMVVTLLHRMEYEPDFGISDFADVVSGSWYAGAVAWGQNTGVVKGYSAQEFAPTDSITREQLAVMLYNYATFKGMDTTIHGDLSAFADGGNTSDWATAAMEWAVGTGLLVGYGNGMLDAGGNATRAQVAVVLQRFCEMKALG